MKRRTKVSLALLALAVAGFLFTRFVVSPFIVVGDSMTPTLQSWDLCLMARVHRYEPKRGEIVLFRTADDPPLYFIKRVIALSGETVAIEHGVVLLNGKPLDEPYTTINHAWELEPTEVRPERIFVIGDNRDYGREMYVHGLVATRLVKTRLLWSWRWKRE